MAYIKVPYKFTKKVSLARAISKLGAVSRKQACQLIENGEVKVNGTIIRRVNHKVDLNVDQISINGKIVKKEKLIYILLNKPVGYITTRSDELNRKTVYDLIKDVQSWVFPVGRLDKDTSGLLILTNDNRLGELLTNPKSGVSKTYSLLINKPISDDDLLALRNGIVILGDYKTLPADVEIVDQDRKKLNITICEGKNRQIRRMFKTLNYEILELTRTQIGHVKIGNLKTGKWRYLTIAEINEFKRKLCRK